jgi:protein-disulfide isomerase
MMKSMQKLLSMTLVVMLVACTSARAQQGNEPAARVGDRVITMQELEDHWQSSNPSQHTEALQALYNGRRAALDDIVATMLIEQAAKAKGLSAEAFETAEIAKRSKPVTDADVAAFYQANQSQMQGRSLDQVAPVINRFLQDQQRAAARQSLVDELRKAGPRVQVLLDAPRTNIDIAATDPVIGNPKAPVTIVEFSDFQCPYCVQAARDLRDLMRSRPDVSLVFRHFPLDAACNANLKHSLHPDACLAACAAECAGRQGRFWEYHDVLFENHDNLDRESLFRYARETNLDLTSFRTCLDDPATRARVGEDIAAGTRVGVASTPTIFFNGRQIEGALDRSYYDYAVIIERHAHVHGGERAS